MTKTTTTMAKTTMTKTMTTMAEDDDDDDDDDNDDDDDDAEEWDHLKNSYLGNGVDAGAASNTSFIALTPQNVKYTNFSREPEDGLDHVLASNTTLNDLSLTLDDDDNMSYSWAILLGNGLARNTSLNNLTLIIENHSSVLEHKPCIDWAPKTSVKNLTLTINNFGELNLDWEDNGLENISLNDFSLTINNYGNISGVSGIPGSLCQLKSLSTLNLTLNLCGKGGKEILPYFLEKALEIESLKTLRIKVNDRQIANGSCGYDFSKFVAMSPSLSLIEMTVSFYGVEESSRE